VENEPEPEVIRQQMLETRTALTEKLEALEQEVVDTVQGAKNAVTDTVETVRDVVQDTVETVKDSMQETVHSVKEAFDVPRQVERHPWAMVGGSVVLGYLSGCLLNQVTAAGRPRTAPRGGSPAWPPTASFTPPSSGPALSHGGNGSATEASSRPAEAPAWLTSLADTFHDELTQLKGLAIGAAMGVARDLLAQSVPPHLSGQLTDVINSVTTKLGGEPVRGPVLSESRMGDR